jgi:NAD(P)-dependent dehydrogenase (short-subunit alcohol dehydrogenase family)
VSSGTAFDMPGRGQVTACLTGRAALVTGSARGIGAETARRLARAGATVVVADLDEDHAQELAAEIMIEGGSASAAPVDVRVEESLRRAIDDAAKAAGRLDILVNNAAATHLVEADGPVVDADLALWAETFRVNVIGTMLATKHAVRQMLKSGGGSIINIASTSALVGDLAGTAYGCSKAAVIAMTRSVATQYGRSGVRCNAVCPGRIATEASAALYTGEQADALLRHYPTNRGGLPGDVAEAVLYLCSEGGTFINGHVLVVDGGYTAHSAVYADRLEGRA